MRKIGVIFAALFMVSWMFSFFCMHAAGQDWTGNSHNAEQGDVEAGAADLPAEQKIPGQSDRLGISGNTNRSGESALAAAQQESRNMFQSRRVILERYGIKTYLSVEDYLPGVVVCQASPELGQEALKCQAVIARTYIYRQMGEREEIQEEELDLDYLGDRTAFDGAGLTVHQKEQLAESLERCKLAAKEAAGMVMKYDDRYILPLFHECSAGRTRTGEADYPYLQSVESRWDEQKNKDRHSATLESETAFNLSDFAARIGKLNDSKAVDEARLPSEIQVVKRDDAGYVLQMKIGPGTYTGDEVQYALELPSACFTIDTKSQGQIIVRTKGRGHGYGLSQHGAEAMAEEGWSFEDILKYYYKNISLVTE